MFLLSTDKANIIFKIESIIGKELKLLFGNSEITQDEWRPNIVIEKNKVVALRIDNCNLKFIPKSIGNLVNLKYLNLSGNSNAKFPKFILKLKNLQFLDLSGIQIISLPDKILNLRNLKYFKIYESPLRTISTSLLKLQLLKEFYIYDDLLSDESKLILKQLKEKGINI